MRRDRAAPGTPYVVDVRGGRLVVTVDGSGEVFITGPAEIGPVRGARPPSLVICRCAAGALRGTLGSMAVCASVESRSMTNSNPYPDDDFDFAADDSVDEDLSAGDYDLKDRAALRRVAGLSTELEDITEVEYRQLRLERVVLVGVWTDGTVVDAENSLAELAALAETAGSQVLEG